MRRANPTTISRGFLPVVADYVTLVVDPAIVT
jgi:hypothetical protein